MATIVRLFASLVIFGAQRWRQEKGREGEEEYDRIHGRIAYATLQQGLEPLLETTSTTPNSSTATTRDELAAHLLLTDWRLLLVLLCLMDAGNSAEVKGGNETVASFSYAESLQYYQVCIAGMQALQHMPSPWSSNRVCSNDDNSSFERDCIGLRTLFL